MRAPFSFHLMAVMRCTICGEEFWDNHFVYAWQELPEFKYPDKWLVVNGALICPAHVVQIDGKPIST